MTIINKYISSNNEERISRFAIFAIFASYDITVKRSLFGLAVGTDDGLEEGTGDGFGVG